MERTRYLLGNWKMHKTVQEAELYFSELFPLIAESPYQGVIGIAPAFTALAECKRSLNQLHSSIWLGAQNVHSDLSGAFTGEVSLPMLREFNVKFVLVGHSERRQLFNETDEQIACKVGAVSQHLMLPVLCIGETLEERRAMRTHEVLLRQLSKGVARLPEQAQLILAYEPVWAIGTGTVASVDEVQEVHTFCRKHLAQLLSPRQAERVSILYGGSVKPNNAKELLACADVDGLLIGGASLDPMAFSQIVAAAI